MSSIVELHDRILKNEVNLSTLENKIRDDGDLLEKLLREKYACYDVLCSTLAPSSMKSTFHRMPFESDIYSDLKKLRDKMREDLKSSIYAHNG